MILTNPGFFNKPIKLLKVVLILALLPQCSLAWQHDWLLKELVDINMPEGQQINSVYYDGRGLTWIGTFNGLYLYDGHTFTKFSSRNGLGGNTAQSIREDDRGNIYCLAGNAINRYCGMTASTAFRSIQLPSGLFVDALDIFPLDTGLVLCGTPSGFYACTPKGIRRIQAIKGYIWCLERDTNGTLYALTEENRLYTYTRGKLRSYKLPSSFYEAKRMCRDATGQVWFMAMHNMYRLSAAGIADSLLTGPNPGNGHFTCGSTIGSFYTADTSVWSWNGSRWQCIVQKIPDLAQCTSVSWRGGSLAIGTTSGLYLATPSYCRTWLKPGLEWYRVISGKDERVFLFHDSLLLRHRSMAQALRTIAGRSNFYLLAHDSSIWAGGPVGFWHISRQGGPAIYMNASTPIGSHNDSIGVNIWEDKSGRIYMNYYHGLAWYEHNFFVDTRRSGLPRKLYYTTTSGPDGSVLLGGTQVTVYDAAQDRIKQILTIGTDYLVLQTDKDKEGNVWLCNGNSYITKLGYTKEKGYFVADSIETEDMIPTSLVFDGQGNLWTFGSGQLRIIMCDKDGRLRNKRQLSIPQAGLPFSNKEKFRLYTNGGRSIYLQQTAMILEFDAPATVAQLVNQVAPTPLLTGFAVHNKPYDNSRGVPIDVLGIPQQPILASNDNFITIKYTGVNCADLSNVIFRYRLLGLDREWHNIGSERTATFLNVAPGKYSFELQAKGENGVWSKPVVYVFTILSPWYQTWWAITLYILLGAGLITILFISRSRYIHRKAQMERLVIEQQLKALRAQINPHFLQNTFDFLSHTLNEQPLAYAQQVIRQLSSYLRNVLYRSDETVVRLEYELDYAEEYLAINALLFPGRFTYRIELADDVDTFGIKLPSMILQPILENAIKYGGQSKGVIASTIITSVFNDKNNLTIKISNDLDLTHRNMAGPYHLPRGLKITQERLALLYSKSGYIPGIEARIEDDRYVVRIKVPL